MHYYEIMELLKSTRSIEELDSHKEEILAWFPCCTVMVGYDQKNHAHQYDLWQHSLHTVLNLPWWMQDDMLILAALLHDVGKPDCRVEHGLQNLNAYYYGHPERSAQIVQEEVIPILQQKGITLTDEEQRRLLYNVRYHDDWMSLSYRNLQRHLEKASLPEFRRLLYLQIADGEAHVQLPFIETHIRTCKIWLAITGDDYAQILSKLTGDEKTDIAAIKALL